MADEETKLQAAIWLATGNIVDQLCAEKGISASSNFIAALTSYIMTQAETLALDAEAFAKHRNSKIIEAKDILLCARKNEALHDKVKAAVDALEKK